jgi:hypothetical protein
MKKVILTVMMMAMVAVSCKKNEDSGTTKTESAKSSSQLYACPMHPEVTGKKDDKCSKCGMDLTEEVK